MLPKIITSLNDFNHDELFLAYRQINNTEKQLFALYLKETFEENDDVATIDIIAIAEPFQDEEGFSVRVYDEDMNELDDLSEELSSTSYPSVTEFFIEQNSRQNRTSISKKTLEHYIAKLYGPENYALYQKKLIEDNTNKPISTSKPPKI